MSNKNKNFIPQRGNTNPRVKKSGKLTFSHCIVICLMVFWSIGSIFGIIATVKGCYGTSSAMKTVSASSSSVPLPDTIDYNGEKIACFDISGSGSPTSSFPSNVNIYCDYTFLDTYCVYIISRTSLPGTFQFKYHRTDSDGKSLISSTSFNKCDDNSNPFHGYKSYDVYYYNSYVECSRIVNSISDSSDFGTKSVDLTFIITKNVPFDLNILLMYEYGILDVSNTSDTPDSSVSPNEDLGFFQGCSYKCSVNNPGIDDYGWIDLPSSYITPYYSGILNDFIGEKISELCTGDYDVAPCSVMCDFGINGKKLGGFSYFMVVREVGENNFASTGEFGSSVSFYFIDGTVLTYNTADDYFSYIDLMSYKDKAVRAVVFSVARSDIPFFGLTSNLAVINQYNSGYRDGKDDGYSEGYSAGVISGKNMGYSEGVQSANKYSFLGLIGAVVDAPLQAIGGLLNFDLLGFNMLNLFYALVTCALIIAVIRMVL